MSEEWDRSREVFATRFGRTRPGTVSVSSFTRQDCDVFPLVAL